MSRGSLAVLDGVEGSVRGEFGWDFGAFETDNNAIAVVCVRK